MTAERAGGLSIATIATVDDIAVLAASGTLDSTTYRSLRDTIVKAALNEPLAVVVDISSLDVPAPSALAVFTSARWQVCTWPQTPIALVCAHPTGRDTLRRTGITRYLPVYATVEQAVSATVQAVEPPHRRRAREVLPADNSSLWRARRVVDNWLSVWALEDLVPVTKVVVTALAENVLRHTESTPRLRLDTDGVAVTVAVEDDSRRLAELSEAPRGGRRPTGMTIVAALSRVWGNAVTGSGKIVWAVIGPECRL